MANAFDEKILGERQKIALAQKLRESGQEIPQGRMVGDRFVGASWTQGLAQALKQGLGAYDEAQAENKIKDLEGERTKGSIEALGSMGLQATPEMLKQAGTPEQKPEWTSRLSALVRGEDQPKAIPAQPYQQNVAQGVTPEQFDAGALKLMSYDPTMAAGAIGLSSNRAAREVAAAEKIYMHGQDKLLAEAKVEAEKIRADARKLESQDNNALKQAMIDSKQAPQGSVVEVVDVNDPTRMVKKNTLTGEVYGYSGAVPKVAAIAPEVSDANAAKRALNFLDTKYLGYDDKGNETKDHVVDLIRQSTSGGLQKAGAAVQTFMTGTGTSGEEALGQLDTIANEITLNTLNGKLGAGISNADRDFLQAKLGDVGNPDKSANQREAAWKEYKTGVRALAGGGQVNLTNLKAPDKVGDIHSEADAILRGK